MDADAFGAALRLAADRQTGAASALLAPAAAGPAQGTPESGPAVADERGDEEVTDEPAADAQPEPASHAAPGIPVTIDALNALLLVGGGTRASAAKSARAELGTVPESTPEPAGAESSRANHWSAVAAGTSDDNGDNPRDSARADQNPASRQNERPDPARPSQGDTKSNDGDRSAASSGAIPEGMKPVAAARADASDFTRALSLRALAAPAPAANAANSARGSPATSPLVVRTITGPRAEAPGRMTPPAGGASTEARKAAFAAQMSRVLTTAAAKGGGSMTMRLAPESLGALTVRVGVEGGVVSARFEAASAEARDLLDTSLSALRTSLEAKGLSVERLQVELAAPETPRHPEDPGSGRAFGGEQSSSGGRGSGGSADGGHADGPGGRSGARGDAEASAAAAAGGRTDAPDGTGHRVEGVHLGLDAVA